MKYCKVFTFNNTEVYDCSRCERIHRRRNCAAFGKTCSNCGKTNLLTKKRKVKKKLTLTS